MGIREEVLEMKKEVEEVGKSFGLEMLEYAKTQNSQLNKANKRMFIIILVILGMWFATIGYLVYVLNDISVVEETVTQENDGGYNNYIGNDGDITNGNPNY